MKVLRNAALATVVLASMFVSSTYAQRVERPSHCVLLDTMANQDESDYLVAAAIQDVGFSPYRDAGARVMERSQRMVGWVFYLYARGDLTYTTYAEAVHMLQGYVLGVIRVYDGNVPPLVEEELPIFDQKVLECRPGTVLAYRVV